jgi:SAM-dependent methyltransferase
MVTPIQNYDAYNTRMSKSLIDKMFFVDKIEPDSIVDFGCANGLLLQELKRYYPESTPLVGYDLDPKMIAEAKLSSGLPIFSCWSKVQKQLTENAALILSSVIHEVYTYSKPDEIDLFWNQVFQSTPPFKYIIIRDLIPSRAIDRPADINDVVKVYRKFHGTPVLNEFQFHWGSIENNKNLIHFLLKHRYQENWKREVKENYFPLYREDLLALIPEGWSVSYHEHYPLPYTKNLVRKEFGIEIKDNTHLKMIIQRDDQNGG